MNSAEPPREAAFPRWTSDCLLFTAYFLLSARMDLKRVSIKLAVDGFRIIDQGGGLQPGEILNLQYEAGGAWTTKQVEFQREAPTFFHPFRKSMFVYTGARPTRVLIRAMDGGFSDDLDTGALKSGGADYRQSYYQRSNFRSYPDFDDDAWDSDDYGTIFSTHHPASPLHRSAPSTAESASGQIGISSGSTEDFRSTPAPQPASALDLNAPLERDSREDEAASGRIGETSESLAPADAPPSLERDSGSSDLGPSDAGGSESTSSEPNAY
jgi:hypothetical protein